MSRIKQALMILYSYGVMPKRIAQRLYDKLKLKGE